MKMGKIKEKAAGEEEATVCSPQLFNYFIFIFRQEQQVCACQKELIIEEKVALSTPATLCLCVWEFSTAAVCVWESFPWHLRACVCDNVNDHFWHEAVGGKSRGETHLDSPRQCFSNCKWIFLSTAHFPTFSASRG